MDNVNVELIRYRVLTKNVSQENVEIQKVKSIQIIKKIALILCLIISTKIKI